MSPNSFRGETMINISGTNNFQITFEESQLKTQPEINNRGWMQQSVFRRYVCYFDSLDSQS